MKIEYTLDENDYLAHQLYTASKSERIRKKRQRSQTILPLMYGAFGILSLLNDNLSGMIIFFILSALWYILYPIWEKQRYIKHYKGFINENYKARIGRVITMEFDSDFINARDDGSDSKISTRELEEIAEISKTIFVRLKGGQSFILPKEKINNLDVLTVKLKELATYLGIKYIMDTTWQWK